MINGIKTIRCFMYFYAKKTVLSGFLRVEETVLWWSRRDSVYQRDPVFAFIEAYSSDISLIYSGKILTHNATVQSGLKMVLCV